MQQLITTSSVFKVWAGLNLLAYSLVMPTAQALDPSGFRVEALNPESEQYGKCENQVAAVLDQIPSETPTPEALTPSLWLERDIFDYRARFSNKLLQHWIVCPSSNTNRGRIDLVVNGQLWGLLDYFERYELLQYFGSGSDRPDQRFKSGYNLRVFTKQGGNSLASYTCDVDANVRPDVNLNRRCSITIRDANNGLGLQAPL